MSIVIDNKTVSWKLSYISNDNKYKYTGEVIDDTENENPKVRISFSVYVQSDENYVQVGTVNVDYTSATDINISETLTYEHYVNTAEDVKYILTDVHNTFFTENN